MPKVIVSVTGKYIVDVPDGLNIHDAAEYANTVTTEVDFGDLSDIEWNAAVYQDNHGNSTKIEV